MEKPSEWNRGTFFSPMALATAVGRAGARTKESVVITPFELGITPELERFIKSYQAMWHAHMYQPIRRLQFEGEKEIYDIEGREWQPNIWGNPEKPARLGFNEKIFGECYKPMVNDGILTSPFTGCDSACSITDWIRVSMPRFWPKLRAIIAEKPGFAMTPTQLILPQVPEIAGLLIDIGIEAYKEDYGKEPLGFWPAELAVNQQTLNILAKKDIRFLVLGRDQIETNEEAPIYAINTSINRPVFVFPYNHPLTNYIADAKEISADHVINSLEYSLPKPGGVNSFAANDLETLGHHRGQGSLEFAVKLFTHILPELVTNKKMNYQRSSEQIKLARLKDKITSWSCTHDGGRWTGNCICGGATDEINKEKNELYNGLKKYLATTRKKLDNTFGTSWEENFKRFYLDQRVNLAAGRPVSLKKVDPEFKADFKRLLIEIMGLQSCAFFVKGDFERRIARNCLICLNS